MTNLSPYLCKHKQAFPLLFSWHIGYVCEPKENILYITRKKLNKAQESVFASILDSHHVQSLYFFQKVLNECTRTFQHTIW